MGVNIIAPCSVEPEGEYDLYNTTVSFNCTIIKCILCERDDKINEKEEKSRGKNAIVLL